MNEDELARIKAAADEAYRIGEALAGMRDRLPEADREAYDLLLERLDDVRSDVWQVYQDNAFFSAVTAALRRRENDD